MDPQLLLKLPVSFQLNAWSNISKTTTIGDALLAIQSGTFQFQINRLREHLSRGDQELYDQEKRLLPAVTFSACFNQKRNRSSVESYNNLLILDIDKQNQNVITSLREHFEKDINILAHWESPSKTGIKGLLLLEFSAEFVTVDVNSKHTYAFQKVSEYIFNRYGVEIDASGSDVTRLCFYSHDPSLSVKDKIQPFFVPYDLEIEHLVRRAKSAITYTYNARPTKDQQHNPRGRNKQSDRNHIQLILRFLNKRKLSITNSYVNWYQVGLALANSFTYDLGSKYFIAFSRLDTEKFQSEECKDMIDYCYANSQGRYSLGTIIHFARTVGYKDNLEKKGVPKTGDLSNSLIGRT